MPDSAAALPVSPPWNSRGFFSEADLRQAQEYYFQTHAKHSRMVAEGRNAQGLMKAMVRKKLTQEMGEDFKMYTGTAIGQAQEKGAQGGIRGELNYLLRHIYQRVAKDQPITSPIQEDLAILKHPHGALEVCFGMVCHYQSLLVRHASLAGNRRKVLKSILDEELFKWVWRMAIAYLLSDTQAKSSPAEADLTAGLPYVPADRQQAGLPAKLFDVGQFMLGKAVGESHLRFPLCFYFVAYLRGMQMHLLAHPGEEPLDALYDELMQRAPETPIDHPLIAVDVLLNMTGNSGESFTDIFKDQDPTRYIPPQEAVFILQFDPFCTEQRTIETLRALIPHFARQDITEQGKASLMPLLLVLRTAPPATRKLMLEKIPLPVMVMLRNRMTNGPQDGVAQKLFEEVKSAMEERAKKGESVQVRQGGREKLAGVTTVAAPAPKVQTPPAPSVTPAPPPPPPDSAASVIAHPPSRQASPPKPASSAPVPQAGPAASSPASAAPVPPLPDGFLDARLLVAWRMEGEQLEVRAISVRDIASLTGREPQMFIPWMTIAFQTGQIFPSSLQVTPNLGAQLITAIVDKVPADMKPRFSPAQVQSLAGQARALSAQKFLLALIAKSVPPDLARNAGALAPILAVLNEKFGAALPDFLRNPSKDEYRERRIALAPAEKAAVAILQKVARLQ
jgi:hypothetical protein